MALKKTIIENNGIQTEYHKIKSINAGSKQVRKIRVDGSNETTEEAFYRLSVTLLSYVSAELREKSSGLSVKEVEYTFIVSAADVESLPIFKVAYDEVKKLDAYAGAKDC